MAGRQMDSRFRGNDEGVEGGCPEWVPHFLCGLMVTGSLRQALDEAGIDFEIAWALRQAEPAFAMYWNRATRVHRHIVAGMCPLEAVAFEEGTLH